MTGLVVIQPLSRGLKRQNSHQFVTKTTTSYPLTCPKDPLKGRLWATEFLASAYDSHVVYMLNLFELVLEQPPSGLRKGLLLQATFQGTLEITGASFRHFFKRLAKFSGTHKIPG